MAGVNGTAHKMADEYAALAGVNGTAHKMADEYAALAVVNGNAHIMADEYAALAGVNGFGFQMQIIACSRGYADISNIYCEKPEFAIYIIESKKNIRYNTRNTSKNCGCVPLFGGATGRRQTSTQAGTDYYGG